jgi:20S proteasome subunit alpha 4
LYPSPQLPSTPQIREFLEKHYTETSGRDTIKLAIRALSETVEAGSKNIEIAVMERDTGLRLLGDEELDALVAEVEADKAAAEAAKRGGGGGATGGGAGPSS